MRSVIVVHPDFDAVWPFAADHFHSLWQEEGPAEFIRLAYGDNRRLGEIIPEPASVIRLVSLHVPVTLDCLRALSGLREAVLHGARLPDDGEDYLEQAGVKIYRHRSEGYWGQSVAEFGLALTLCGLRRIPQLHREIVSSQEPWNYRPPENVGHPRRGQQFGDDLRFSNGTLEGKRVRIVGMGNIGSRYASFVKMLGADVAAWDPFAGEPCFHRSGARKEWHLDQLVRDAEVFAPMLPLTGTTEGIITADHIQALPQGCLVVLVTRARICDMKALRARVLRDELGLAADVFDVEPLPLDDPLLGRHNVVHTPHNAGRTVHANRRWAEDLNAQFQPREVP